MRQLCQDPKRPKASGSRKSKPCKLSALRSTCWTGSSRGIPPANLPNAGRFCFVCICSQLAPFVYGVISEEHRKHRQNITGQDNTPRRTPYRAKVWDELTHGQRCYYTKYSFSFAHLMPLSFTLQSLWLSISTLFKHSLQIETSTLIILPIPYW